MANTGYITSSGIVQMFTTGPYSGSEVTSSYSDGSLLFGDIIDTTQLFISGDLDTITPCEVDTNIIPGVNYFERFYFDPTICPPDNICISPVINLVERDTCSDFDPSIYNITYNFISPSADYTIIEYSTSPSFSITGSTILDNSSFISPTPISVLINGLPPQAGSPVYFRAYNSCSNDTISGYSSTSIADNCVIIQPPYQNFTFTIVNETNFLAEVSNTSGTSGWTFIPPNNTTGISYTFNTSTKDFWFKVQSLQNCPNQNIFIELTTTTPSIGNIVQTSINSILDPTDCSSFGISSQTTQYPSNPEFLHYPNTNINSQISTNILINRTNWFNQGNIKLTIKYQPPGGPSLEL
jgi:hypothetical protein